MKNFLHAKGLWNFVEDGVKELEDEAKDAFSLYYVQQDLDDNIFYVTTEENTAKKAWKSLKRRFVVRGRLWLSHILLKFQQTNLQKHKKIVKLFLNLAIVLIYQMMKMMLKLKVKMRLLYVV